VLDEQRATADAIVSWARDLVPTLRARGPQCEALRRIPPETVADFVAAGAHRVAQPARFGGFALGIDVAVEVGMEIGRGCASSAWMATQWPGHNFMVGMFPEQTQEEYFAAGPDTLSSTASALVKADVAPRPDGSLEVSGQWKFSSGVDEASWLLLSTKDNLCLVPKADFRIVDDWFTSGLRGSGSKSVVIDGAVVPRHRAIASADMRNGRTHGAELYDDPFYRVPYILWAPGLLAAAVIGMAQGVLDLFEERVVVRTDMQTRSPAAERPGNQLRFAESAAEVDAARLLLRNSYAEQRAWGTTGGEIPMAERARARRDITFSVRLCLQAVARLVESGDASAIYDDQLIQRFARDIRAAALQVSLPWDEPAIAYSRVRWGLPPETVLL
jgi:alkylation response protein AidB-like acyl-CoA dehydrogenase